jgi:hypothetical protein
MYKLVTNLKNLVDLNNENYNRSNPMIDEVYHYLDNHPDDNDNGLGLFGNLLFSAFSLIGSIPDFPPGPFIAWFLSGIVDSINTNPPPDLNVDFGNLVDRYSKTTFHIEEELDRLIADPEGNLDKEYKIPDYVKLPPPFDTKKTIKVRELLDVTIPDKYELVFAQCADAHKTGFRNELVKQELPRVGGYAVGAIHIQHSTKYNLFIAKNPPDGDRINWTDGDWVIKNDELQLQGRSVTVTGDSFNDFNKTAGSFNELSGGLIVVTDKTDTSVSYKKYYMLQGFSDGEWSGWYLGSNEFYNWLFKDDGFGNIIRPGSVGMRDDIYRNWVTNGNLLPPAFINNIEYPFNDLMNSIVKNAIKSEEELDVSPLQQVMEPTVDSFNLLNFDPFVPSDKVSPIEIIDESVASEVPVVPEVPVVVTPEVVVVPEVPVVVTPEVSVTTTVTVPDVVPVTESVTAPVTVPDVVPVTESVTSTVTEPDVVPVTESVTAPVTVPDVVPVTESVTSTVTEPDVVPVTESVTAPVTVPDVVPVTESVTAPVTVPDVVPVTESVTAPVTVPDVVPVTESVTAPVTVPDVVPVTESVTAPVTVPAVPVVPVVPESKSKTCIIM